MDHKYNMYKDIFTAEMIKNVSKDISVIMKMDADHDLFKVHERYRRLNEHRALWEQYQLEREERKCKEHERKELARQQQEKRWQALDSWYDQQPDRLCIACQKVQPASSFGYTSVINGSLPILHVRCKLCHKTMLEHRLFSCCVCQEKTSGTNFLSHFNGYALRANGISLPLCCKMCEPALLALSQSQQRSHIHSCCLRTFPVGQVIYAEIDPEIHDVRYIGRTSRPRRRHAQHLRDTSSLPLQWGPTKKIWYTRGNWIETLANKGLTPSMQILQTIEPSPLVLEWEQRYIWHAIQQGWNLLNLEAMDEGLVARVKTSPLNYLSAPFEILLQQHFFSSTSLSAFLHTWYK